MATTNDPVKVPFLIEQVGEVTGAPDNEQVVSFAEKLEPEMVTLVPMYPELGAKEIDASVMLTV